MTTRRLFLRATAAAGVASLLAPSTAVAESPELSPLERARHHLEQLCLAMEEHTGASWSSRLNVKVGAIVATEDLPGQRNQHQEVLA